MGGRAKHDLMVCVMACFRVIRPLEALARRPMRQISDDDNLAGDGQPSRSLRTAHIHHSETPRSALHNDHHLTPHRLSN